MNILFNNNNIMKWVLIIIAIIVGSIIVRNPGAMTSVNWYFPYFSGAANLDWSLSWKISPSDYDVVAKMKIEDLLSYNFAASENTIINTYNNPGFMYVVWFATNLFFWLGDMQAVIVLQLLIHIVFTILLLKYFIDSPLQSWLFFLFYAVNPVVLHFVTFPFYYFWTVVPAFILAVAWLRAEFVRNNIILVTLLLLFSIFVRPAVLFVVIFIYAVTIYHSRLKSERFTVLKGCAVLFVGLFLINTYSEKMSPAHTMYVGIGAYDNPFGIDHLADEEGYKYYKSMTGKTVDTHTINGSHRDAVFRDEYLEILSARYIEIIKERPLLIIKNALLNTVQAFGPGYDVDRSWTRPFTLAIGCLVITLFIYTKQWFWLLSVLSYAIGFTPYFPPIPAYLFGAYLLLVLGVVNSVDLLYKQIVERRS